MYYTIKHFLEAYPMGKSSFYRLVNSGQIQITKFGRSTRIAKEEVERWVKTLPFGRGDD
jgi:excisionase family DNA binding protein